MNEWGLWGLMESLLEPQCEGVPCSLHIVLYGQTTVHTCDIKPCLEFFHLGTCWYLWLRILLSLGACLVHYGIVSGISVLYPPLHYCENLSSAGHGGECLLSQHSTWEVEAEGIGVQGHFGYIASTRPAWIIWSRVSKKKRKIVCRCCQMSPGGKISPCEETLVLL